MKLHSTPLNGCIVLTPTIFSDQSGQNLVFSIQQKLKTTLTVQ